MLGNVNSSCWLVGAILYLLSLGATIFIPRKFANSNRRRNSNEEAETVGSGTANDVDLEESLLT